MICFSWPPRELHPNARPHFHAKAKAAKAYRETCYWLAKSKPFGKRLPSEGPIRLHLNFCPPDNRRRDLDGILSNFKAGLDGLADACEVDDYRFELLLTRSGKVKNGCIEVTLE